MYNIFFGLLHVSVILVLAITIYLIRIIHKKQMHKIFIGANIFALLWSLGYLFEVYTRELYGQTNMIFVYIWYLGLIFTPIFILLTGIVFAKTRITISKYSFLFIIPIVSFIVLLTNEHHHLFFLEFSPINTEVVYGVYFFVHSVYSYSCIVIGLGYLLYFSVKNSKFFSNQSILIFIGSLIPLLVNIPVTFKLLNLPAYTTAISFSMAMLCFAIAIFRYSFLSVTPIALHTVVDRISDSFLVINEEYQVIDFNKSMMTTFNGLFKVNRSKNLKALLEKSNFLKIENSLIDYIEKARVAEASISFQSHIMEKNFDKHFKIEITPITSNRNYLGTIILFKDITENINNIAAIEEKHAIMMEQERMASLGQLIGGIAHNLKTSIMSIAGAVEGIRDLVSEYESSVGDSCVTAEDHKEIAEEMRSWLDKIKPYCSYMTDVINTVKGQTMQYNDASMLSFTINELVKRIELLLKYELIRYNCRLITQVNVNFNTELCGDINSLVQIFDNIIINAIQAYEGKNGVIELSIEDSEESIIFSIKDYAKGIPEGIKSRLLKEMITTKGKDGTGLGLYMSYSTIKGRFEGKMWFESEEGKGTTFFIKLPHKKNANIGSTQ